MSTEDPILDYERPGLAEGELARRAAKQLLLDCDLLGWENYAPPSHLGSGMALSSHPYAPSGYVGHSGIPSHEAKVNYDVLNLGASDEVVMYVDVDGGAVDYGNLLKDDPYNRGMLKTTYLPDGLVKIDVMVDLDKARKGTGVQMLIFGPDGKRSYKNLTTEETPVAKLRRLLDKLETNLQLEDGPAGSGHGVMRLAESSSEVRDELFEIVETGGDYPQLRWFAMEVLCEVAWDRLVGVLVQGLGAWDRIEERTAVLGAVVTIRKQKVPDQLRPVVQDNLRNLLTVSGESARSGSDPLQAELLVQALVTFGSFAEARDILLLKDFWNGTGFEVSLAAVKAATRVSARYPSSDEVEAFFASEGKSLEEAVFRFAKSREVAVENGVLLWSFVSLLLSRGGEEIKVVMELGKEFSNLVPRILKLYGDAAQALERLKEGSGETWREHFDALGVSLKAG